MCFDPVTLAIGAGLMVAGTAAQQYGQKQARDEQRKTYAAEAARQDDLSNQAYSIFNKSADAASEPAVSADMAKSTEARKEAYGAAAASTGPAMPSQATVGSAPRILNNAVRGAGIANEGATSGLIDALARLNAFGDAQQNLGITFNKNRLAQAAIGDRSRGSMRALEYEVADAANKGSGLRMLGDLLVGGGQIGVGMAAKGAGPAGTNPLTGMKGNSMTGLSAPWRGPGI